MVIVCCLQSFLPFLDVTISNVAGSAQGHQVIYGISNFASAHPTRFYVVDVNRSTSTYFAGYPRVCIVAKCLQIYFGVVLHLW